MSFYDKCKKAESLAAQALLSFGENSDAYRRARAVQSYWYDAFQNRGGAVLSPPPSVLAKQIVAAEREVEKDKARKG